MLSLLIALDKENGLRDFFDEVKDDTTNYISFFYDYQKYIGFERKIPLDTICKVINSFYITKNNVDISNLDIFKLYRLKLVFDTGRLGLIYYLPEGIKFMDGRIEECDYPYLQDIRECIESKSVIFPSSLKVIRGKPFGNVKVDELILNEGLEYISSNAFYNQKAKSVVIPSTLEKIDIGTFNFEEIRDLKFTNFKNSRILSELLYSDSPDYKALVGKMFFIIKDNMSKTKINSIIFSTLEDELGNSYPLWDEEIIITLDDYYNNCKTAILETDIKLVREYFLSLIYEETGYKIEPINEENNKILKK